MLIRTPCDGVLSEAPRWNMLTPAYWTQYTASAGALKTTSTCPASRWSSRSRWPYRTGGPSTQSQTRTCIHCSCLLTLGCIVQQQSGFICSSCMQSRSCTLMCPGCCATSSMDMHTAEVRTPGPSAPPCCPRAPCHRSCQSPARTHRPNRLPPKTVTGQRQQAVDHGKAGTSGRRPSTDVQRSARRQRRASRGWRFWRCRQQSGGGQ